VKILRSRVRQYVSRGGNVRHCDRISPALAFVSPDLLKLRCALVPKQMGGSLPSSCAKIAADGFCLRLKSAYRGRRTSPAPPSPVVIYRTFLRSTLSASVSAGFSPLSIAIVSIAILGSGVRLQQANSPLCNINSIAKGYFSTTRAEYKFAIAQRLEAERQCPQRT
jgi:hypothetical protein